MITKYPVSLKLYNTQFTEERKEKIWSPERDWNTRQRDLQSSALPAKLSGQHCSIFFVLLSIKSFLLRFLFFVFH